MYGLVNPAWNTLFRRKAPLVKVFDVRSDEADLTTYTFTECNIPEIGFGGYEALLTYGTHLPGVLRTPDCNAVVVIAHGEAATATFGVNSISLGGVAGFERIDRGGGTSAINTAIYIWTSGQLASITNTDIVVTWSKAITSCAIGVLGIYNIGPLSFVGSGTGQSTTSLNADVPVNWTGHETHLLAIGGSTLSVGAGAEGFNVNMQGISGGGYGREANVLYEEFNTEISFAAFWGYTDQYCADQDPIYGVRGSWSGAAVADIAMAGFV